MLALIVADRNAVRVVQENVGGHERRIGEQSGGHEIGVVALVLELRHASQFTECGGAFEDPRKFRMFGDMALDEQGGLRRIDSDGEQQLGQFEGAGPEFGRVLGDGQGVQIDHTEDGVGFGLIGYPVAQGTEEVSQLDWTGGFDPGKHSCHGLRS